MTSAAAIFGAATPSVEPAPAVSEPAAGPVDNSLFAALMGVPASAPVAPDPVAGDQLTAGNDDKDPLDSDLLAELAEAAMLLLPGSSAQPASPPTTVAKPALGSAAPVLPRTPAKLAASSSAPADLAAAALTNAPTSEMDPGLRAAVADIAPASPGASASTLSAVLQSHTHQAQPPNGHAAVFAADPADPQFALPFAQPAAAAIDTSSPTALVSLRSVAALAANRLLQLTPDTAKRVLGDSGTAAATAAAPTSLAAEASKLELALPPGSAEHVAQAFTDGMAARLDWMAEQKMGKAEISLHPAELGSIEVQLQVDGGDVRVEFSASTPEARQLIESSLPRLRELFQAHGLALTHADVGQHDASGQQSSRQGQPAAAKAEAPDPSLGKPSEVPGARRNHPLMGRGLSEYA